MSIESQPSSAQPDLPTRIRHDFSGSQELLRRAAQSLANTRAGDDAAGESQSVDDEISGLRGYAESAGAWLFPRQKMNFVFRAAIFALCCWFSSCEKDSASDSTTISLSAKGLDLNNQDFVFKLADQIGAYANIDDTPESVARLQALPEHWRYIEPLIYYYNQVNNGGHHQYFWNSQGIYRDLVAKGLKYFQASDFEPNYLKALSIYQPTWYEVSQGATYEEFDKAYSERRFDEHDGRFFEINPDLAEVISAAIRQNIEKYQ